MSEQLLRLWQIIGDPRKGTKGLIPVSKSGWWAGVREGRFPRPVKLSARVTCWRLSDVQRLIETGGKNDVD